MEEIRDWNFLIKSEVRYGKVPEIFLKTALVRVKISWEDMERYPYCY